MSYLDTPRLSFTGFFQADVSTVNNDVRYYDIDTFRPQYQKFSSANEDKVAGGAWNPEGTGAFRLVDCKITGARLGDILFTTPGEDPVIGMSLENAEGRVSGKLVDLDPQQQAVSEIWGMQVRLTDHGATLFSSDYEPAAFINLWRRQKVADLPSDQTLAAVYQSVLRNVGWKKHGSAVLEALRAASREGMLSINMNVFGYGRDPKSPRYTLGHVIGTIGPYHAHEPKHFVVGRQTMTASANAGMAPPYPLVYNFTAKVDRARKTICADFGNALRIEDAGGPLEDVGTLILAVATSEPGQILTTVAPEQVALIGELDYRRPGWYEQTSGIQDFDYRDLPAVAAHIDSCPLLVLGPLVDGSYPVLIQESLGGLYVRTDNYVVRLNPGESADLDLYASRYGEPLPATVSFFASNGGIGGSGSNIPTLDPPVPVPVVGTGSIGYPGQVQTGRDGKGTLRLSAPAEGPGNPRGYIDGQLYGIGYQLTTQPAGYASSMWNFVSVLAFDRIDVPSSPTWFQDIKPIFQQYGNLYPIMSKHLVDLGDYDSVVKHLNILDLAFSLPVGDPNHMPVTRDLSDAKRAMILKWMRTPGYAPLKGQDVPHKPVTLAPQFIDRDTIPLGLLPIQTGGKTEVVLQILARKNARKVQS
jgi:hypothetical protein